MPKRCLYDILNVDRSAGTAEIKKQFHRMALKYHPDKISWTSEHLATKDQDNSYYQQCVQAYQEIQNAYEILMDVHERKWYDDHREQILRDEDDGASDEEDRLVNLWPYFSVSVFAGYGDDKKGFYSVYRNLFEEIVDKEGDNAPSDEIFPSFGSSSTSMQDVEAFYSYWRGFTSFQSFAWTDVHRPLDAPNRQIRRLMEKENKKIRETEKKKYTAQVRALVDFIRKMDRRVLQYQQRMRQEAEKRKREEQEEKREKMEEYQRQRQIFKEEQEKLWEEQEKAQCSPLASGNDLRPRIIAADEEDAILRKIRDKNNSSGVEFCGPCKKSFKSRKQYENHIKSKKHRDQCEKLGISYDDGCADDTEEKLVELEEGISSVSVTSENTQASVECVNDVLVAQVEPTVDVNALEAEKAEQKRLKEETAALRRKERKEKRKADKKKGIERNDEKTKKSTTTDEFICETCEKQFESRNECECF